MLIKGNKYVQCGWDYYEVIALASGEESIPCCYAFAYEDWIVDEGLEDLSTEELIKELKANDETIIYHNEEDLREYTNSCIRSYINEDGEEIFEDIWYIDDDGNAYYD